MELKFKWERDHRAHQSVPDLDLYVMDDARNPTRWGWLTPDDTRPGYYAVRMFVAGWRMLGVDIPARDAGDYLPVRQAMRQLKAYVTIILMGVRPE